MRSFGGSKFAGRLSITLLITVVLGLLANIISLNFAVAWTLGVLLLNLSSGAYWRAKTGAARVLESMSNYYLDLARSLNARCVQCGGPDPLSYCQFCGAAEPRMSAEKTGGPKSG